MTSKTARIRIGTRLTAFIFAVNLIPFLALLILVQGTYGTLDWVRAGHDPAIIYDPANDKIEELKGNGIPLGIDENYKFQMNKKTGLAKGQIIVLSTDGIWEARNRNGELFGKDRFFNLIRKNAILNAASILNVIIDSIKESAQFDYCCGLETL